VYHIYVDIKTVNMYLQAKHSEGYPRVCTHKHTEGVHLHTALCSAHPER